jgi:hypothetical protein
MFNNSLKRAAVDVVPLSVVVVVLLSVVVVLKSVWIWPVK